MDEVVEQAVGETSTRSRSARTALLVTALAWITAALVGGWAIATMEPFLAVAVPGLEPQHHSGAARVLLDPWQQWDGQWYLRIARNGYADDGSAAFFPFYPALIRIASPLTGGDALLAALLLSWIAFAGAMLVLSAMLLRDLGEETATTALLLIVTFPTAFFFHAAYTESLFLLLAAGTFLAARRRRWIVSGLLALGACLTRSAGFALVPALLVEAWTQSRGAGEKVRWRDLSTRTGVSALLRTPGRSLAAAAIPLLALPALLLLFDRTLGDPWAFSAAQRLWERHTTAPWTALIDGVRVIVPGGPKLLDPLPGGTARLSHYGGGFLESNVYNLIAALGGIALAVLAVRRLPPSYAAFAVVGVLLPLLSPSRVLPLYSMPRFLLVLFPLFVALAIPLQKRPLLRAAVLSFSASLQGLLAVRFALWYWVA
jgi:hypothetical protein